MNNRWMALILLLILIYSSTSLAYTIEGNSVFLEDSQASLRVTPHTATSPVNNFRQEFEVCNKTETETTLYAGYLFDDALQSGKVEYWQVPVYDWVEYELICNYDFNYVIDEDTDQNPHRAWCYETIDQNGTDVNVVHWEHEFKDWNVSVPSIQYDINKVVSGNTWLDVTTQFTTSHQVLNDRHIYPFTAGLAFPATTCKTWAIEYTPDPNTINKKWDLWLWADTGGWNCILTDTCQKTLKLDPWWNNDWDSRFPINDLVIGSALDIGVEIRIDSIDFSAIDIQCADLNDLRIVDENANVELERIVMGNSSSTDGNAIFELANPIETGTHDGIFYIYTNNSGCPTPPENVDFTGTDGFEDGDYTNDPTWEEIGTGGSTITVVETAKKFGTYGLRFTTAGGSSGQYKRLYVAEINEATGNYSAWIKVGNWSDSGIEFEAGDSGTGGKAVWKWIMDSDKFKYGASLAEFDEVPQDGEWYRLRATRTSATEIDYRLYNADNSLLEEHLGIPPTSGAGDLQNIFIQIVNTGADATTIDWDNMSFMNTVEPLLVSYTLGTDNTAPTMSSIDLNASYSQQGGNIKVTATGTADTESDAVSLLCGTASNPTVDTNNFCTAYAIASPYSTVECVGQGTSGDASNTIYCRLYDGELYSTEETDTYTADNTAPSVTSAIMNAGSNLIGVDYDLNMTITDAGSGLSGTPTYKCWSSGSSEEGCTSANWDCKTGNLTDNGSNSYGVGVDGTLKDTSGTWTCKGYASDAVGLQGTDTDTETMNETTGYTVDTSTITYSGTQGSTENPALTDQANAYIIFTHNGNTDLNVLNLCDSLTYSAYTIPASNHKWLDSDNYAGANICSGENQILDDTWSKGTYPTTPTKNLYFWLDVPVGQQIGSYTGTITVGASKSGS